MISPISNSYYKVRFFVLIELFYYICNMKTIKITDELHDRLRTYSFFKKLTIQETITLAVNNFIENSKSVKVEDTTSVFNHLDWTDKEAQNLISPEILEKFNIK